MKSLIWTLIAVVCSFTQVALASLEFKCNGQTPEYPFEIQIQHFETNQGGNDTFRVKVTTQEQITEWSGAILKYDPTFLPGRDGYDYEILNGPGLSIGDPMTLKKLILTGPLANNQELPSAEIEYFWRYDGGEKCYPPKMSLPGGCSPTFSSGGGTKSAHLQCTVSSPKATGIL